MSLTLVSNHIGNDKDINLRTIEVLTNCELIIAEERKPLFQFLAIHKLPKKDFKLLNEHSTPEDLKELIEDCKNKNVILITDSGTPGFCDPGQDLVGLCRKHKIQVTAVPGPSCLTTFLSLVGHKINQFIFLGFPPKKEEDRVKFFNNIRKESLPIILMDTPYRLAKILNELKVSVPNKKCIVGYELTTEQEIVFEGRSDEASNFFSNKKGNFILMVLNN